VYRFINGRQNRQETESVTLIYADASSAFGYYYLSFLLHLFRAFSISEFITDIFECVPTACTSIIFTALFHAY
jgi:hypothetical protein